MYLSAVYHNRAPKLTFSDVEALRCLLEQYLPGGIEVVDATMVMRSPAVIAVAMMRGSAGPNLIYYSSVQVWFAKRFWTLQLGIVDADDLAKRELAVCEAVIDRAEDVDDLVAAPAVFDRVWDGLVPLKVVPLARLRRLTDRLVVSIQLRTEAVQQDPFRFNFTGTSNYFVRHT